MKKTLIIATAVALFAATVGAEAKVLHHKKHRIHHRVHHVVKHRVRYVAAALPKGYQIIPASYTRYVGMSERGNRAALRSMLGVDPVRTPWCGAFMSFIIRKKGLHPPAGGLNAFRWLSFGHRVSSPQSGDVVVLKRGHVGMFVGFKSGKICVLAGNHSNKVGVGCYSMRGVAGIRRG